MLSAGYGDIHSNAHGSPFGSGWAPGSGDGASSSSATARYTDTIGTAIQRKGRPIYSREHEHPRLDGAHPSHYRRHPCRSLSPLPLPPVERAGCRRCVPSAHPSGARGRATRAAQGGADCGGPQEGARVVGGDLLHRAAGLLRVAKALLPGRPLDWDALILQTPFCMTGR